MLINIGYNFKNRKGEKISRPDIPKDFFPLMRGFLEAYFRKNSKAESAKEILDFAITFEVKAKPFLLKDVCVESLDTPEFDPKERRQMNLDSAEKRKRSKLAGRIYDADKVVELSTEEIVLIKRLANLFNPEPLIIDQVEEVLENPIQKEPKKKIPKEN